jgi:hypothetical protein
VLLYVLGLLKCDNLRPFLHTPENWRCMIYLGILEVTRTLYIYSYVVYCMFVTSSLLRFYTLGKVSKRLFHATGEEDQYHFLYRTQEVVVFSFVVYIIILNQVIQALFFDQIDFVILYRDSIYISCIEIYPSNNFFW